MAERSWASGGKIYSMHVAPVLMNATAQIGATGAIASFVGSGIQSVTRQGTGLYRMTCQANTNFSGLFYAQGSMQSPPSGLSGVLAIEIQNAPNASVATNGGAILNIKTLDAAGALVDPASGSALNIMMVCSNSSVKIGGE